MTTMIGLARTPTGIFRRAALAIACAFAILNLAACGGGGDGASAPAPGSKAFAADPTQQAIGSVVNPDPGAGPLPIDRIIMGPNTGLSTSPLTSLVLDTANDRLYVGSGASILVFNSASMADGNISPSRAVPGIGIAGSLFLDTVNNRLYVGDNFVGVRVFDNASGINGVTASTRFVTGNFGTSFEIFGVAVDTVNDILYVSAISTTPSSTNHINVFDAAHLANSALTPNRTIVPTITGTIQSVRGIFLDAAHDRLYVAGDAFKTVMVFEPASTADGAIAPTKVISFPASGAISNVFVDVANDRLYAVSFGSISIVHNVSTLTSGSATATAAVAPPGGGFSAVAVSP